MALRARSVLAGASRRVSRPPGGGTMLCCHPPSPMQQPAVLSAPWAAQWRAFSRNRTGKAKLSFKLAKKLLRIRNDAVPFRQRQKRALMFNVASWTLNNPFESYLEKYVSERMAAAEQSLTSVWGERFGVTPIRRSQRSPTPSAPPQPWYAAHFPPKPHPTLAAATAAATSDAAAQASVGELLGPVLPEAGGGGGGEGESTAAAPAVAAYQAAEGEAAAVLAWAEAEHAKLCQEQRPQ